MKKSILWTRWTGSPLKPPLKPPLKLLLLLPVLAAFVLLLRAGAGPVAKDDHSKSTKPVT